MVTLASSPILPAWLVLPIAGAAMLVIAAHTVAIQQTDMPASRKRIRTANGVLMLFVTAMLAYALSIMRGGGMGDAPDQAREFVLVWMVIMGLLPLVIALAGFDAVNTLRLHTAARRVLRRQMRDNLKNELMARRAVAVRADDGARRGAP
jgi:hypothetical protein